MDVPFVVRKMPGALGEYFCDVVRRIHIMLDSSIAKATPALVKAMEKDDQAKVMGVQCRPGLSERARKDLEKQAWLHRALQRPTMQYAGSHQGDCTGSDAERTQRSTSHCNACHAAR